MILHHGVSILAVSAYFMLILNFALGIRVQDLLYMNAHSWVPLRMGYAHKITIHLMF